jgi:alpha-beta hydrolase superfamily lysophospholipase
LDELRTFRASDGYSFYFRHYRPIGEPRARLVFIHGIRSHSSWYVRSSAAFASTGIEVFFLDRRGAGLNTTHRATGPSFRRLLDDVAEFIQSIRCERGWLPLFLGGISWGGKLAVGLPYRKPGLVDGLILLCPGLIPRIEPSFLRRARIAVARLIRPERLFPIPLNEPHLFTASSVWQTYIDADPYGLRQATARFLFSSFSLDIYLLRAAKHLTVPVFLTLAQHDRIIDNQKTRTFAARFAGETTIVEYANAHHTLEFETEDHPWVSDVSRWIAEQVQ